MNITKQKKNIKSLIENTTSDILLPLLKSLRSNIKILLSEKERIDKSTVEEILSYINLIEGNDNIRCKAISIVIKNYMIIFNNIEKTCLDLNKHMNEYFKVSFTDSSIYTTDDYLYLSHEGMFYNRIYNIINRVEIILEWSIRFYLYDNSDDDTIVMFNEIDKLIEGDE